AGFNCTGGTPTSDPTNLQIFVYSGSEIDFSNGQCLAAAIYAPTASFSATGPTTLFGGIATGGTITATNGLDFHGSDQPPLGTNGGTSTWSIVKPQGFVECHANPTDSSNPESGC